MPTRRQSPESRTFRQEAFASSTEMERGILGNLVAARCAKLTDPEEVALIWWLQQVSWREGGLTAFAKEFLKANTARIGTPSMHKFGMKPGQVYRLEQVRQVRDEFPFDGWTGDRGFPLKGDDFGLRSSPALNPHWEHYRDSSAFPTSYPVEKFLSECHLDEESFTQSLQKRLVDPASPSFREGRWNFPSLWDALVEWRDQEIATAGAGFVETDIASAAFEELDFALETKSFVLIEGREGIGKSQAAKNWVARHPGRAVYVRVESGNDEASLFRAVARAVGTACAHSRKPAEIRARVEDVLQTGQLMLVMDEAHFLWPSSPRPSRAAPRRLDWLRTAIIDFDVPVALLSTPQYFEKACDRFRAVGWNANQIQRRLANTVALPETPSMESVFAVTRHYFPKVTTKESKLIAGVALASIGFLTTIVHLRKRVDFLKSRHPETSEADHLRAALSSYLDVSQAGEASSKARPAVTPETPKTGRCSAPASPMQPRFQQPNLHQANPLQEPALTTN